MNVTEYDDEIIILAELPNPDIGCLGMSVAGQQPVCEISYGNFKRTVALPDNVDKASAKLKLINGVLQIIFKKNKLSHMAV